MVNNTILLTGASGFLGRAVQRNLFKHTMITTGRSHADISIDLVKGNTCMPAADIVVHAAGKAHTVPHTAQEKQAFFDVNVQGTINLLMGLKNSLPKSFVFISTVAVYGMENGLMINEEHPLTALDPYGLSKVQAEKIVQEWCQENGVICTILRLPLLIGPNPPGNLKAMIEGIKHGYYMTIAGGKARRSMVLADDVAKIIPMAAITGGIYNLTDGYHPSFTELSSAIAVALNKKTPLSIPAWLAGILAVSGNIFGSSAPVNSRKLKKMTNDLTFDDSKAVQLLGWLPHHVINNLKLY
ncbi:NAD-dependent epimerase/dehydratase family protein [Pedobacter sp. AW31-3R]|uniref:NAD-dependent epimerase/dehydratase family protein n=1 Tax=Pedobacter sp. AW31-3R TaxID=3445781 RepID=UPI003FA192C1